MRHLDDAPCSLTTNIRAGALGRAILFVGLLGSGKRAAAIRRLFQSEGMNGYD